MKGNSGSSVHHGKSAYLEANLDYKPPSKRSFEPPSNRERACLWEASTCLHLSVQAVRRGDVRTAQALNNVHPPDSSPMHGTTCESVHTRRQAVLGVRWTTDSFRVESGPHVGQIFLIRFVFRNFFSESWLKSLNWVFATDFWDKPRLLIRGALRECWREIKPLFLAQSLKFYTIFTCNMAPDQKLDFYWLHYWCTLKENGSLFAHSWPGSANNRPVWLFIPHLPLFILDSSTFSLQHLIWEHICIYTVLQLWPCVLSVVSSSPPSECLDSGFKTVRGARACSYSDSTLDGAETSQWTSVSGCDFRAKPLSVNIFISFFFRQWWLFNKEDSHDAPLYFVLVKRPRAADWPTVSLNFRVRSSFSHTVEQ